jgi:ferredoxin
MRAEVLANKCMTNGDCVRICPEIFQFTAGSKKATVVQNPIPEKFKERCITAARMCPQGAIKLTEIRKARKREQ